MNSLEIRIVLLKRLVKNNCWNEKHTAFERVYDAVPSHLRGCAKKEILKLIKENLILAKKTNYGLQLSLNIDLKKEIEEIISNN